MAAADVPATGVDARPRLKATHAGRLALLVGLVVVPPLAIAAYTGSLSIPHNDAWAHSRIAQTYAGTGQVTLLGWNRSSLLGQVLILGPLGADLQAQHLFVAACGVVSLVMTYLLVRPRAGDQGALLATIALGVVPEFGLLTTSFMADIPALAGALTCLWAGDRAIRRGSSLLWWSSLLVGLWAITVREQAVVAAAAVLLASWHSARDLRPRVVMGGLAVALAVVGFEWWRRSMPGDDPPGFAGLSGVAVVTEAVKMVLTLGFYLVPVLAAVANPWHWRPLARWAAFGTGVVVIGLVVGLGGRSPLLGNYVGRTVAYTAASVGAPVIVPRVLWVLALAVAVLGTSLLMGQVIQAGIATDPLLISTGMLLVGGTLAQAALGQGIYSRYLLLLVPVAAGLLLPRCPTVRLPLGIAVAAFPLVLGSALTAGTYAYDSARWAAAQDLVAAGASPQDIDAGLEWVGTHADGPYVPDLPRREARGGPYVSHFESARVCHLVAGSPQAGLQPSRTFPYATFGVPAFGSSQLYVYSGLC